MALYLGSDKVKVSLDGIVYAINTISLLSIIEGIVLSSFDDYILKDYNGCYLLAKEEN